PDAGFNVTGWNSSYTGAPIPEGEMREWRDTTVERILALAPKRVLEIGCGTGLLLTQIAPRCERYAATDFSRVSLDLVRGAVSRRKDLAHVELFERGGDDFGGFETAGFDLVVLNSVVQYFPDVSYLDRVLDGALRSLSPGGRVFVGDVRDARLQRVFAASVALHGVDGATAPEEAAARADRLVAREEELLASPGYFALASKRAPGGGWAEALVKRGRADNELTRFRYDVVIHAGDPGPGNGGAARELAWAPGVTDTLVTWMESPGGPILLRGVPNARIAEHIVAARWLDAAAGGDRFVPRDAPMAAISAAHPEDLADLAAARGYAAACGLTADDEASFDVAFFPTGAQPPARAFAIPAPSRDAAPLVTAPVRSTIASALVAAVREHAAARLPESMMPSAIVLIDALPLTPSGKIDRRALASLDVGPRSGAWAPPRTPTERAVARVWSDVLGVARVGAHDGFFDLGGHSLLATQVTARLGSALGVEIPLRAIFESPTVAALASYIDRSTPSRASREPIPRVERGARLPLSVAQTRLWFIDRLEPGGAAYNIPTALRLGGRLDVVALGRTLGEISRRHEILRARIVEDAEGPSLVIEPPGADALPAEDLTRQPSPEDAARSIVAAEAVRPFDLSRGPLLRVRLLRIGPEDHVLSLVVHHIVADGWSTGVMVRELGALYDAFAHGVPSPLADLAIQYVDWSAWQRRWLDAGELDRQLAYWRGALAGVEPLGILTDRTRPPRPSYAGAAIDVSIAPAVVERVAAIAREEGATLHMALLAAYVAVLARWSGQDDLAIGTPVAGRTREETEPL
ncbi:MAG TPA: condensation domain-containing protein, partial [Verrucomicrobiae bacterium]|nr:condensation domain-containing protein [Verrucomicrobiae bacterium]